MSTVRATVGTRQFQADSWIRLVASVLFAFGKHAPRNERRHAANQLRTGVTAVIGGVLIKPEGARE